MTSSSGAERAAIIERRSMTWREERLQALYTAHATGAMRLAYFLTRDSDAANDLVQEAFVRVGGRLPLLRDPENAKGYLYRTINNLAKGRGRGLIRRRKLEQRLPLLGQESEPDLGERQEMWERLLKLPIRQRTALFLRYYADLSEAEAAGVMDCSTAAIKSLTHRAIDALRSEQGGYS